MRKACVFVSVSFFLLVFSGVPDLEAQGHWEFSAHYGRWSLNFLGGLVEDNWQKLEPLEELLDDVYDKILAEHSELFGSLENTLSFKSSGDDYGLGIRWYPGGRRGGFSLGLAVHQVTLELLPSVTTTGEFSEWDEVSQTSELVANYAGTGTVEALIKATTFHVTLRVDFFPSSPVTPYFTFGGGASTAKFLDTTTFGYLYEGQLTAIDGSYTEEYEGDTTKTLRQLLEEEDVDLPIKFLPILELNLGLKAKITKNIHVLADAGLFNGLLIRGGLAIRL